MVLHYDEVLLTGSRKHDEPILDLAIQGFQP
jgi:hypothetical protein